MGNFVRNLVLMLHFCAPVSAVFDYSIVFVHLGKAIPPYVQIAIDQAREFNPQASMILLANQEALEKADACSDGARCIACESLVKSDDHEAFLAKTALDAHSRDGFWLYASERFLYLADLIAQHELHNVFHLEYDNMLYVDLQELLPIFQKQYPGIAATFDNDERCIPGFVYIRDSEVMNRLAKFFGDHAGDNLDDMHILAMFKNETSEAICDHLPIITKEYVDEYPLVSNFGHVASDRSNYFKNIDVFKSIFDAAALGQFLGGIDPRNGESAPGFINERCLFKPSLLKIEWIPDNQNRKIPYVVYPHARYRINNLHIHSKNLERFKSKEAP